jgi:hypothetical protein
MSWRRGRWGEDEGEEEEEEEEKEEEEETTQCNPLGGKIKD